MEVADRDRGEQAELAVKVFALSQSLTEKWLNADIAEKAEAARNGLFELHTRRRKSLLRNEKAL
jgi:hypothetical protein